MPPPPGRVADMPLFATAFQDRLSIYRDSSGQSLHRRGYRQAMHRASLNEAAAAGCLSLAGWPQLADTGATLADPMVRASACVSSTNSACDSDNNNDHYYNRQRGCLFIVSMHDGGRDNI